jgi:hypothetical protein
MCRCAALQLQCFAVFVSVAVAVLFLVIDGHTVGCPMFHVSGGALMLMLMLMLMLIQMAGWVDCMWLVVVRQPKEQMAPYFLF